MPLPEDKNVLATSQGLLDTLHGIFGPHPGYRPAHAKGILLSGSFRPSQLAKSLSIAPHLNRAETPVLARFSSSTGIPSLPDTDANGNPRGLAIRFVLAESPRRVHTDIVSHSTPFFPAATGEEALEFFKAVASGSVGAYLASHPAALAFVQAPKPTPSGFGTESYYSVNAFKLIAAGGKETFIRYRIVPKLGEQYLDDEAVKDKSPDFLFDGVVDQLKHAPLEFSLKAQLAGDGDVTDNNTVHWPETRQVVDLGTLSFTRVAERNDEQQKGIIFDPIPRVEGIEPSGDPLLEVRAGVYLLSGQERRAA